MNRRRIALILAAAIWGGLLGCGSPRTPPSELRVAAAADLTKAFTEIAAAYQRKTGQKVTLTFGSTGLLTKQIENGAPFDVFAAANESYVAQLEKEGHTLPGTAQLYALGRIVLWARKDGPPCPPNVAALLSAPRYRKIALANPDHAPYGVAAREAMRAAKVWDAVQPRLVYGENVQQTLQYAESGNADVAIVALSLAIGSSGDYTPIPEEMHRPLRQVMAALNSSPQPAAAKRFVAFVNGPEGRPLMRKYGFLLPDEKLTAAR